MQVAEQTFSGPPLHVGGAKVTVSYRCTLVAYGTSLIATLCPTSATVVMGETVAALAW